MKLIQDAQSSKPNVQHLADRAQACIILRRPFCGTATFIVWLFVLPQGAVFAATAAVAVVVVACPHALGLAIPTVTTITSTLGAKNGILIKEMKGLEIARKLITWYLIKPVLSHRELFGIADIVISKRTQSLPKKKY